METLAQWMRVGGFHMWLHLLCLIVAGPLWLVAVIVELVAAPNRKRRVVFSFLLLSAACVFLLVGVWGYMHGVGFINEVLTDPDIKDPEGLKAIGMKEARVPLIVGIVLAVVPLCTSAVLLLRRRHAPPEGDA